LTDQHPRTETLTGTQPAITTIGNSDTSMLGEAPFAGTVTSVTYTPDGDITGAATHNRTFEVVNRGAAGAGTTSVASLNMASGVNATGGDEKTITLSGTAANLVVAAGDILAFKSTAVGNGIADPGGLVQVTISRD
jgi:hypothetical protein